MTKKHYEAIAKEVANTLATCDTKHASTVTRLHAYRLADYFETDNKNFNRDMFLAACGIDKSQT